MPQSFCVICRQRISRGSRCAQHRIVSPSSKAWHARGAAAVRQKVLDRDRGCRLCGKTEDLQVHHVEAAAAGGATTPSNLIVLCGACHLSVEKDELAIPAGHLGRTEAPEGLRSPEVCAVDVTQRKEGPNWAS
jgi:5-methylcytosine-specific restriction endonuclease McrA